MWPILSCTEEEKAEARAFEEDQVAGRLKEDVVSMGGVWGCGGRWSLPPGLHSSSLPSLQLEQRGRLQKSVAKEVSVQGTLVCGWSLHARGLVVCGWSQCMHVGW